RKRIDALGPAIENVKLKTLSEATCQSCIHRVVVGIHVRRGNEYCEREEILRNHRLDQVLINKPDQLVTRAALITDRADEIKRQFALYVQRIRVDVSHRRLRKRAVNFNS